MLERFVVLIYDREAALESKRGAIKALFKEV